MILNIKVGEEVVASRRGAERNIEYMENVKAALTPAQFKFLKEWTVDGKNVSSNTKRMFKAIRDRLEGQGLLREPKTTTLYRGINISVADMKRFLESGVLKSRDSVESWTSSKDRAYSYAGGAAFNGKSKPVGIVIKASKGNAEVLMDLGNIANAMSDYIGEPAPFNKEVIVSSFDIGFDNVVFFFSPAGFFNKKNEVAFGNMLAQREKKDGLTFEIPKKLFGVKFGITKAGKINKK